MNLDQQTNMRKVYLEKRSSKDCDFVEESQVKQETISDGNISDKILELDDIDVFLQREMENFDTCFSDFFTLDMESSDLNRIDSSDLNKSPNISRSKERSSIPKDSIEELKNTLESSLSSTNSNSNDADLGFFGFV